MLCLMLRGVAVVEGRLLPSGSNELGQLADIVC